MFRRKVLWLRRSGHGRSDGDNVSPIGVEGKIDPTKSRPPPRHDIGLPERPVWKHIELRSAGSVIYQRLLFNKLEYVIERDHGDFLSVLTMTSCRYFELKTSRYANSKHTTQSHCKALQMQQRSHP